MHTISFLPKLNSKGLNEQKKQAHTHTHTHRKENSLSILAERSVMWSLLGLFCYLVLLSDDVLFYVLFLLPKLDQLIQHLLNLRERK